MAGKGNGGACCKDSAINKTREMNPMFEKLDSKHLEERQYDSPLAQKLVARADDLAELAGRIGEEEWLEVRLIRGQLLGLAGQVNGLLVPEEA